MICIEMYRQMSGISYIVAGAVVVVLWRVHKKHGPIS